jgi:Fic family protein
VRDKRLQPRIKSDSIRSVAMDQSRDSPALYEAPRLGYEEEHVIARIEALRRGVRYAVQNPRRWTGLLARSSLARAIRGSNSIEGYNITVEDAMAAVDGEQPVDASTEAWLPVLGYRQAMTYVIQLADDPHFALSTGLLRSLHFMMMDHNLAKNPGRWRSGPIFVHSEVAQKIVYEAPDAELVPALMGSLVRAYAQPNSTPPIVRAALAHLNLVMIHPFADGNGRMARCLQTLILAREGILEPQFCSIEEWLGRNTEAYYSALAAVGQGSWHPERQTASWVRFILKAHFQQAMTLVRRVKETERVWDLLEMMLKGEHLPARTILALHDAAFGWRVRNATYRAAAEVSDDVAGRDLKLLAERGLLIAHGERRHRYYVAAAPITRMRGIAKEPDAMEDPFATFTLPLPLRARQLEEESAV